MQQPIELAQNPEFSDIQPGVEREHARHALIVYPTRQFPEDPIGDGHYILAYGYSGKPIPGARAIGHPDGTLLRMRCLERPLGTLVITAREASIQEEIEYGIPQEDL